MSTVKLHKLLGKTLCNIFDQNHLTKCAECGIMENSARLDRQRAVECNIYLLFCQ